MKACICEATTMPRTFEEDIHGYADGGCHAMEVWLTKLEQHLKDHSIEETDRLIQERGMELVAAAYQGGLLLSQGEQRRAHFDHFRKRLDLCQRFKIPIMLLVADFVEKLTPIDIERAIVSLKEAAQWAQGSEVKLALEFRGTNRFCSCLPTALALVNQCGEPNVGVNFDVHHYYIGPSKYEDLALLTADKLTYVQVSDLPGIPRELATDGDRILPGDGELFLEPLIHHFEKIGYAGYVSLELMNPMLWEVGASQVAELGLAAVNRLLESAEQ